MSLISVWIILESCNRVEESLLTNSVYSIRSCLIESDVFEVMFIVQSWIYVKLDSVILSLYIFVNENKQSNSIRNSVKTSFWWIISMKQIDLLSKIKRTFIKESEFWNVGDCFFSSGEFFDSSGVLHCTGDLAHTEIKFGSNIN